jgi:hypothetical protein
MKELKNDSSSPINRINRNKFEDRNINSKSIFSSKSKVTYEKIKEEIKLPKLNGNLHA